VALGLITVARLVPVWLASGSLVAAGLPIAVVVATPLATFGPARLVAIVALVPGCLVRIALAADVGAIKFVAVRLAGNSMSA
jgi:hypothetical protein